MFTLILNLFLILIQWKPKYVRFFVTANAKKLQRAIVARIMQKNSCGFASASVKMVQNNASNHPTNHPLVIFFYYNNIHRRLVPNTGSNQNNTKETSCCPSNRCNNNTRTHSLKETIYQKLTKDQDDLVTRNYPETLRIPRLYESRWL